MIFNEDENSNLTKCLTPEQKLLWWLVMESAKSFKLGLTTEDPHEALVALECLEWFFNNRKMAPAEWNKKITAEFRGVCEVLGIDAKRIRTNIRANPEFPTYAFLRDKLFRLHVFKRAKKGKKS